MKNRIQIDLHLTTLQHVLGFCANRLPNLTEAKTIRQSMSPPPRRPQIQIGASAKPDNFWQPVCYAEAEISISELLFIEQSDS